MNRFWIAIKRTPTLIILIIMLVVYMPTAILLSPETERNAIVTALGIDRQGEELELSLLCFVPQANLNYSEKFQVVTSTAATVSESLEKASTILGRTANLNHIECIVLSEGLLDEDVSHLLDHFARTSIVQSGCLLSATNGKAKDAIELVNKLNGKTGVKLEDIFRFSEMNFYGRETTIESFYSGYYSPTGTSFMGYIETLEEEGDGLTEESSESQGGGSSGGGSSGQSHGESGGESKPKSLSNTGKMVLMKRGEKKAILDFRDIIGLNYMTTNNNRGTLKIEGIEFEKEKKSDVVYQIIETKTLSHVDFSGSVPVIKYKVRLKLDLFEVVDTEFTHNPAIDEYIMSPQITNAIEKKVKQDFANVIKKIRETKTDALQIYEKLEKADKHKFNMFLEGLEDKETFLDKVIFAISVESSQF